MGPVHVRGGGYSSSRWMLAFSRYLIKENTKQGIRETGGGGEGGDRAKSESSIVFWVWLLPSKSKKKKKAKEKSSQ